MTARVGKRPLTGQPARDVIVTLGYRPSGAPQVSIDAVKYRATTIPVNDPALVRALIVDLHLALAHLEGGPRG